MKIEQLRISGFRCFGPNPQTIRFGDAVTAFVGNNGSGKTAVIAALGKLFGVTTAQRTLQKSDFHVPVGATEVAADSTLFIDCVLGFPDLENAGKDPVVPEVFGQMAASGEGKPLKLRIRLQAKWIDDTSPDGLVEEDLRWVHALDDGYDWDDCEKVAGYQRGLVQLVYVPASRNAYEQVTNLLKSRIWRAAVWSKDFGEEATSAATRVQERFDAERPAKFVVERLERRWNEVRQGDTGARPILKLIDTRLGDLVRQAEFVFDPNGSSQARHLKDLSDGQRSLFHIALTAATLEIERDALLAPPGTGAFDAEQLRRTYLTILAIEEPENSLAPFFLSKIMTQAREIGSMTGAQVILTSHSASILARVEPEEVRYCRRASSSGSSQVTKLNLPNDDEEARRFVRLAVQAYPELYFARFVVLAEGESESIVLPKVAEAMGVELDRSFVPIVPLGGRFVQHFWRLLEGLRIPYATLLDLDLGRRHGGAATIKYVVEQLAAVGRDMSENLDVAMGEIDLDQIDAISDEELLDDDQEHPWLRALRDEGVFFSSPIDIDFAMLICFEEAYRRNRPDGRGPRRSEGAIEAKKLVTLKSGGNPDLYGPHYDEDFLWYPYLFLTRSKPETHLLALGNLDKDNLEAESPFELRSLVQRIQRALSS